MVKVAIYEDNVGLRDILATIIRQTEGMELAGEFGHCIDAIANCKASMPDVVIMDIDMPGRSGIYGVKEIKQHFPKVEIIMNTVFDDDDRVFEAIKSGATGYILKHNSLSNIIDNIRDVMSGGAPMTSSVARKLLNLPFASTKSEYNLTDRELEVLKLLSKGYSYKMVANEVLLSIDTIRSHVKRIYEKLHVHSVTEAIHKIFIEK